MRLRRVTLYEVRSLVYIDDPPMADDHHSFGNGSPSLDEPMRDLRHSQNRDAVSANGVLAMLFSEVTAEL